MERLVIVPAQPSLTRDRDGALFIAYSSSGPISIRKVLFWLILQVSTALLLTASVQAYQDAKPPARDPERPVSPASAARLAAVNRKSSNQPVPRSRTTNTLTAKLSPSTAPPAPKPANTTAPAPQPRAQCLERFKVRDDYGRLVAARWYGEDHGKTALILPDGQLGIAETLVPTKDPFVPLDSEELRRLLQDGPYANYQVLTSPHYLIFYKSTLIFAEDSARMLESIYRGLIDVFRRHEIPVHEAEFPLVAVIFATERDFRLHKEVDPEVQAYYEIFTNRIFFYQRSDGDRNEPKIAALRKPQTVAHEGAHQILANLGVQPRLSAWPLWLVEGLAEYCATPANSKKKGVLWDGLGMINSLHMATLRELGEPAEKQPLGELRPVGPGAGRDKRISRTESLLLKERLTTTDYAEAWALTHYLAQKRSVEFVNFLRDMSQVPPLAKRTPDQNFAVFTKNFAGTPSKLDKKVDEHIVKLSQKGSYDPLPYYAVIFEQPIAFDRVRRAAFISQSPQIIERWVDQMTLPDGGAASWQALQYPTRTAAYDFASQWMRAE
jgi:hypothetical protein